MFVIFIIFLSEKSIRFSRLIAKRNPVATLATLILLSYAKLLLTVITTLSFATLHYLDGSTKLVWLPDVSIDYLSGRHIVLFIAAVIILVIGIVYTLLLFFWQWLLYYQHMKIFNSVRNQKLCHFFEPYHAPYSVKHRYWTGLLLLARVSLYLVFALNVSGDPGVSLLAVSVMGSALLVFKGNINELYKNRIVDKVELFNYFNVVFYSGAGLFVLESGRGQTAIACISFAIFIALFLFILAYQMFLELCAGKWNKWNMRRNVTSSVYMMADDIINNTEIKDVLQDVKTEPTTTIISGRPQPDTTGSPHTPPTMSTAHDNIKSGNEIVPVDSSTPLLLESA